jgi:hypothetical protein
MPYKSFVFFFSKYIFVSFQAVIQLALVTFAIDDWFSKVKSISRMFNIITMHCLKRHKNVLTEKEHKRLIRHIQKLMVLARNIRFVNSNLSRVQESKLIPASWPPYVQYNYDAGTSLQWYEFTVVRVDNKTNESVNRSRKRLNRGVISFLQRNGGKGNTRHFQKSVVNDESDER